MKNKEIIKWMIAIVVALLFYAIIDDWPSFKAGLRGLAP